MATVCFPAANNNNDKLQYSLNKTFRFVCSTNTPYKGSKNAKFHQKKKNWLHWKPKSYLKYQQVNPNYGFTPHNTLPRSIPANCQYYFTMCIYNNVHMLRKCTLLVKIKIPALAWTKCSPLCQSNVNTSTAELQQTSNKLQHSARRLPAKKIKREKQPSVESTAHFLFFSDGNK